MEKWTISAQPASVTLMITAACRVLGVMRVTPAPVSSSRLLPRTKWDNSAGWMISLGWSNWVLDASILFQNWHIDKLGLERPVYKAFWVKEASPETCICSFGHVTNPNFCWPKIRPNTSPFAVNEIRLFLWDLDLDLSDETLCFEFIWNCLKEDTRDSSLSFCHEIWEMSKFLTLHSGWTT